MKYFALAAVTAMVVATPAAAQITAFAGASGAYNLPPVYQTVSFTEDFEDNSVDSRFSPAVSIGPATGSPPAVLEARPLNDTSTYYGVLSTFAAPNTSLFNTTGLLFNQVSFYWGSQDNFNQVEFLNSANTAVATFTGTTFNGDAADDGQISRYVTFNLGPATVGTISGIRFSTTGKSFEFDNFQLGTAVPEASTWAMMMVGFGFAGGAMRRRRSTGKALAAA